MRKMKHQLTRFALLPTMAAAFSLGAVGQAQTAAGSQNASASAGQAQAAPSSDYRAIRASNMIGASVRNAQGQDLGEISDMVVNLDTGEIRYAVLEFDPGLFSGERLFAVPLTELRMGQQGNEVVYANMQRERLERAGINRNEWNQAFLTDRTRMGRVEQAWNSTVRDDGRALRRASDLLGTNVSTPGGDTVGSLEELVINASRQRVHYAVMSFDPGWLQEERRVVLPLNAFQQSTRNDDLLLNVSQQQARAMRNFDQRQYSNLNDRDFVSQIDRVLVVTPVISSGSGGSQGTQSMGAPGTTGSQPAVQQPQRSAPRGNQSLDTSGGAQTSSVANESAITAQELETQSSADMWADRDTNGLQGQGLDTRTMGAAGSGNAAGSLDADPTFETAPAIDRN